MKRYKAIFKGMAVPSSENGLKLANLPGRYEVSVSAPEGRWQARIIGGSVFVKGCKSHEAAQAKAETFFNERLTPWTEELGG